MPTRLIAAIIFVAPAVLLAQTDSVATSQESLLQQRAELLQEFEEVNQPGTLDKAKAVVDQIRTIETRLLERLAADKPEGDAQLGAQIRESLLISLEWLVDYCVGQGQFADALSAQKEVVSLRNSAASEAPFLRTDARRKLMEIERYSLLSSDERELLTQASSRTEQAIKSFREQQFAAAEELVRETLMTQEELLGEDSAVTMQSVRNLAFVRQAQGQFGESVALLREVNIRRHRAQGADHPESRQSLSELIEALGDLVSRERNNKAYAAARLANDELTTLSAEFYGENDYRVVDARWASKTIDRLAGFSPEQHAQWELVSDLRTQVAKADESGWYADGVEPARKASEILENLFGSEHPEYAHSLNRLALLYDNMSDYARAEPLYNQALQIRKAALGEQHPDYSVSLNNLALMYADMGDYARAEPLYTQALQIDKAALGEQHPDYATALNNLALLYYAMDDYARAEPLFNQAMMIYRNVLGEQHEDYAMSLNNLGLLYVEMGDVARAEPLYKQAIEINRNALGEQHPAYSTSLNNLATLYDSLGKYAQAEPLYTQALQIDKQVLGERHPSYALSLNNLAMLYVSSERCALAIPLYEQALAITHRSLEETAYVLSERQQLAMNQSLRYQFDNYLNACLAMPEIPARAVENVMLWKGSVLHRLRGLRIAADDPAISEQFAKLQQAAAELSRLAQAMPEQDQAVSWRKRVAELTAEKEILEAQLMRSSAAFRDAVQQVTLGQIQQSIPEDGVLVDYLEFAGQEGPSLLASIVTRNAEPHMIALGSATEVSQAIDVWRATFGMSPQAKSAGLKLRELIWEPVLAHVGSAKTVLVSTDGVLGRLPFAALPGKAPGSYLIEDHRLALIPVPQLLPALVHEQASKKLRHELLLMGDVNYDEVAGQEQSQTPELNAPRKRPWERSALPQAVRGEAHWNALSETRAEVEFIAGLYNRLYQPGPEAVLDLRQTAASETAFRAHAPECVFLHLATHGFFAAPDKQSAMSAELVAQRGKGSAGTFTPERDALLGYSPGQLSGIVFAGANRQPDSGLDASNDQDPSDDGIMTADEIAFMRLEGVRLAVLSACETGLGEVAGGEGLLGIQRGFQMAGARSTVASLWKVNDAATRRLMQEFYTNYLDKELSMLDALRETQLWALNHPGDVPRGAIRDRSDVEPSRLPPQYWAPFVLSGDWR